MNPLYRRPKTVQAAPARKRRKAAAPLVADEHAAARTARHDGALHAIDAADRRGRRIQVRRSGVHGKGVFALQPIGSGDHVITYKGELITWAEAQRRHPHDPSQPDHTFFFHIDDEHVIDANVDGNAARWINHSCAPNCIADDSGGKVRVLALRDIAAGEELFYDYGLVIDERMTPAVKKRFACRCGAPDCRGTMLAPRRRR